MFRHYHLRCQEHDLLLFDLALEVFTLLPSLEIPLFGVQRALQMYCEADSSYTFHSHNHSQNIREKLYFSCEMAHYRKSSIYVFHKFFLTKFSFRED